MFVPRYGVMYDGLVHERAGILLKLAHNLTEYSLHMRTRPG